MSRRIVCSGCGDSYTPGSALACEDCVKIALDTVRHLPDIVNAHLGAWLDEIAPLPPAVPAHEEQPTRRLRLVR